MEGYTNFPPEDFEKHVDTFYPLGVNLLNREMGLEIRIALQALLKRIGEVRMGMPHDESRITSPLASPRSVSSSYFATRRGSRGR